MAIYLLILFMLFTCLQLVLGQPPSVGQTSASVAASLGFHKSKRAVPTMHACSPVKQRLIDNAFEDLDFAVSLLHLWWDEVLYY